MRRGIAYWCAVVFLALAGGLNPAQADLEPRFLEPVTEEVLDQLLREDFLGVVQSLSAVGPQHPSAVLRAIKAHADLATNRNDESFDLFVSIADGGKIDEWEQWTQRLLASVPESRVAAYLHGDALARKDDWPGALTQFNRALGSSEDWYLALNARGVIRHALGKPYLARRDFVRATEAQPGFADAHANRGTVSVLRGATLTDEKAAFGRALEINPKFSLALNGRACNLYGNELFEDALDVFAEIPADSVAALFARHNIDAVELARLDKALRESRDAGMFLTAIEGKRAGIARTLLRRKGRLSVAQQITPLASDKSTQRNVAQKPIEPDSDGIDWGEMIQIAYERLEALKRRYARECGGGASSATCKELQRQIEELEKAIEGIGEKKKKRADRSVIGDSQMRITPPRPLGIPGPVIEPPRPAILIHNRLREAQVAVAAAQAAREAEPGGVKTEDQRKVRRNVGKWLVVQHYGLLYDVQAPKPTVNTGVVP